MNHIKSNMKLPTVEAEKLPRTPEQFAAAGYLTRLELKKRNPKLYELLRRNYKG